MTMVNETDWIKSNLPGRIRASELTHWLDQCTFSSTLSDGHLGVVCPSNFSSRPQVNRAGTLMAINWSLRSNNIGIQRESNLGDKWGLDFGLVLTNDVTKSNYSSFYCSQENFFVIVLLSFQTNLSLVLRMHGLDWTGHAPLSSLAQLDSRWHHHWVTCVIWKRIFIVQLIKIFKESLLLPSNPRNWPTHS